MVTDREREEEAEHYYKTHEAKPRGQIQYATPAGPEHPHSGVKIGRKEQGPTRADLEAEERRQKKEKEAKFKRDFEIEKEANAARLRGEKRDAKQKAIPPPKPHPMFGGAVLGAAKTRLIAAGQDIMKAPPKGKRVPRPDTGFFTGQGLQQGSFKPARGRKRPPAQQGFFSSGGQGMPSFSGDLLGGWGAAPKKRKKNGWGLL